MDSSSKSPSDRGELAVLAAAATVVVLGLLLLVGGALAALLSGGGWTWPSTAHLATTIGGVLTHAGEPARGYEPSLAPRIPGPVGFWVTVCVLFAVVLMGAVIGTVGVAARRAKGGFATRAEIDKAFGITTKAADRGAQGRAVGPVFASYLGRPVTARAEDTALVIAPARAGKTTRIAAPLVKAARGSVVATSTKADLVRLTAIGRQRIGPVHVVDFDRVSAWPDIARWDIVRGCEAGREAMVRSKALVAGRPLGGARNADFFAETADTVLRCLLHAAALNGASMREVQQWARNFDDDEPYNILRKHPGAMPGWVDDLRKYCRSAAHETVASTNMSLGLAMKSLADPDVLDLLCPEPGTGFDAEEFVNGEQTQTLYVLSEGAGEMSTAPLVTALVATIERAGRRASQHAPGGRLARPITFVLDEAPNVAPLPNLPSMMADGGSRGMSTWVFAQAPSQLRERWGNDGLDLIADPAAIELVFGGLQDTGYLERVSRLCGEQMVARKSYSTSRDSRSTSVSQQRERVLPVEMIRTLPEGKPLMLYRSMRPAIVTVDGWWERPDAHEYRANDDAAMKLETRP
jgi:type IV secretion system protein VirD4